MLEYPARAPLAPFVEESITESTTQKSKTRLRTSFVGRVSFTDTKDEYSELPESIRMNYTREEYLWLSDHEKATIVQRECEPEA
jgi:hypothetical protein